MGKINQDDLVLQNIFKNVNKKSQKCFLCDNKAINSHLLQRNGILNHIEENGHIVQLKGNDIFKAEKEGILSITNIGVKNAMSYPLFCSNHDSTLFEPIEQNQFDLAKYLSQVLFSYRSLCAEIRKKENNVDIYSRIQNSVHFSLHFEFLSFIKEQKTANQIGIENMNIYKVAFEEAIFQGKLNDYHFETIELDFYPVSISAVYSPIIPSKHTHSFLMNPNNILDFIFINLIPQANSLFLIIGYHKNYVNNWILDYISKWKNNNNKISELITDLVSTKVETWAISPHYFKKINKDSLKKFKNYWEQNAANINVNQKIDFDIFE